MSGLDTTPLRDMAIAYLCAASSFPRQYSKYEHMTDYEQRMLNELVEMFSDFDARFVQYPLLAGSLIAQCVRTAHIDHEAILRCLEVFITADHLARRGG